MRSLIVTGATGGLGTEVVRQLSGTYECVALYRGAPSEGLRGVQADLGEPASVRYAMQSIAKDFGAPYGLVHLAGGFAAGSLAETSDETWAQMLGLHLTGAFVAIRETLAIMDRGSAGRILVISSDAARTKLAGTVAYTVSKSALNVLIELLAKELKDTAITANALMPSALDTPAMRKEMPREKLVPLERVGETLQFLLSDAAANITGALIPLTAR
jgi:NAD(P)-dependent dehydrogenase (short-subunit alcohol dehydrogenase family)